MVIQDMYNFIGIESFSFEEIKFYELYYHEWFDLSSRIDRDMRI